MKKQRTRIVALWLTFILIDVLIAGGIMECWVRCFIPVKNIQYFVDNKIGVRYSPNQRTYGHVEQGYSNITITNSLGFHDVERESAKDNTIFRIHIYGDSMIAGMGVPREYTIPSLVEKHLKSYGLPVNFEVMNMATGTESTCGQIVTYQEIGTKFDPDVVICYFMGDFTDNLLRLSGNKHAPYYEIDENNELVYRPPVPKDTETFFAKFKRKWCMSYRLIANNLIESKFYYNYTVMMKKLRFHLKNRDSDSQSETLNGYNEARKRIYIRESWPLTLRLIAYFRDEVHKNMAEFILADGRPFNEPINTVYTNNDLERFCKLGGIHYIPANKIYSEIKSSSNPKDYFFVDGHPNERGNDKISSFLAKEIKALLFNGS